MDTTNKIYITDLLGKSIEVTDLNKAIEQAQERTMWNDPNVIYYTDDITIVAYWTDILLKLQTL